MTRAWLFGVALLVLALAACGSPDPVDFDPIGEWKQSGPDVESTVELDESGTLTFRDVPYVALFPPIAGGEIDWSELRSATGTWVEADNSQLAIQYQQSEDKPKVISTLTLGIDDRGEYLSLSISADKGQDFRFYRAD